MDNIYSFNDKKEKIKTLPYVRKEVMELEFSYRVFSLNNTLQTGTLKIPITFYKNGAMVLIDTFYVSLQMHQTVNPEITYDDDGIINIIFSHYSEETSEGNIGVDLVCTSTDKFKKYCPVGHKHERIFTERNYAIVEVNGHYIYTNQMSIYAWININKDEMIIHLNQIEAGMAVLAPQVYMADNID